MLGIKTFFKNKLTRPKEVQDEIRTLNQKVKTLQHKVIDVMVWGASRPDLLEQTLASFKKYAKFSGEFRFFFEDGLFDRKKSAKSVAIAKQFGFNGIHAEAVGSYGWAMTQAIDRWVRAPYMFSLEDDFICLQDIDFDLAWDLFEQHPHVNQLRYNRRPNYSSQNEGAFVYAKRTLELNGKPYSFLGGAHWYFNPALWRMSFMRPRWKAHKDNIHFYVNSHHVLLPEGPRPHPDWYADELGVLTWGGVGEPAFFDHIGAEDSIHKKQNRV